MLLSSLRLSLVKPAGNIGRKLNLTFLISSLFLTCFYTAWKHLKHTDTAFRFVCFQYYPLEEVLAAEYLLEDFRPDLIEMVLDKLRPEFVRSVQKGNGSFSSSSTRPLKNANPDKLTVVLQISISVTLGLPYAK